MTDFDMPYWEHHWRQARHGAGDPNPHLVRETGELTPGTALDAGCGQGAEAIWLASRGWAVTAVDISSEALRHAGSPGVEWVRADLTTWTPATPFDLVVTHYAHPAMPQLAFYRRIAEWVAPGGTLLVVGHAGGHHHVAEASATVPGITELLDDWEIVTAEERVRTAKHPLHDVVVRARRKP
ncbi:class I SAM-dependent methyltransferase [Amycolatopsis australiensis]|uniref:Methyltransferase domain-containing protein n=1 Tax=Amycolatopsis australiensis TaxID=546364 RepID=A0A1K1S4H9_9PSEU|nr:class I SAM-dependent methyltransferase [Amycolatopsis australiensis]SFW79344.1 Methyltransferase domain-containing protein [Amycolatopsis australiensis]